MYVVHYVYLSAQTITAMTANLGDFFFIIIIIIVVL